MDETPFDFLVRVLGRGRTRRRVVSALAACAGLRLRAAMAHREPSTKRWRERVGQIEPGRHGAHLSQAGHPGAADAGDRAGRGRRPPPARGPPRRVLSKGAPLLQRPLLPPAAPRRPRHLLSGWVLRLCGKVLRGCLLLGQPGRTQAGRRILLRGARARDLPEPERREDRDLLRKRAAVLASPAWSPVGSPGRYPSPPLTTLGEVPCSPAPRWRTWRFRLSRAFGVPGEQLCPLGATTSWSARPCRRDAAPRPARPHAAPSQAPATARWPQRPDHHRGACPRTQ